MRKVHLHGHLGKTFGPVHEIEVATAGEAVRAFNANFRNFTTVLREGAYEVVRGDKDTGLALDLEDINEFKLGNDKADLHFIPVVAGAKRGGVVKAILGTVLVGASMFLSGGTLATALPGLGSAGVTWGNVAMIGLGMAVAGASQLLTAQDKKKDEKDQSYSLSGATNTYEQGNPVPLVYGEVITGGHLISAGIDIEQMKANPT